MQSIGAKVEGCHKSLSSHSHLDVVQIFIVELKSYYGRHKGSSTLAYKGTIVCDLIYLHQSEA